MAKIFTSLHDPELAKSISHGAIGVIPTDTVYGLVAQATLPDAVHRMYAIKSRPRQPGTTIAASLAQLESLGFSGKSLQQASQYWPDAISIEMDASSIATYLSTGQSVMAVRIPNHPELLRLLEATGPLMTTSANIPDQPTSTNLSMAMSYFGDTVDFYVEGGDLSDRPPSTIIGLRPDGTIVVYRQGAVHIPS